MIIFANNCWVFYVKLHWNGCWAIISSQHWFRWWLVAVSKAAITWANADPDLHRHMVSIGHNVLKSSNNIDMKWQIYNTHHTILYHKSYKIGVKYYKGNWILIFVFCVWNIDFDPVFCVREPQMIRSQLCTQRCFQFHQEGGQRNQCGLEDLMIPQPRVGDRQSDWMTALEFIAYDVDINSLWPNDAIWRQVLEQHWLR